MSFFFPLLNSEFTSIQLIYKKFIIVNLHYQKAGSSCSNRNKEVKLVETKVRFISDGCNGNGVEVGWGVVGVMTVQRLTPPSPESVSTIFHRLREAATCRNSTVHSNSHREIGLWWSDGHHLHCFGYN